MFFVYLSIHNFDWSKFTKYDIRRDVYLYFKIYGKGRGNCQMRREQMSHHFLDHFISREQWKHWQTMEVVNVYLHKCDFNSRVDLQIKPQL